MNKKKIKMQEEGITLIALIITIALLLILSVVVIRGVQGDRVISHTKNVNSEYTILQEKEQIQLAQTEWKNIKKYSAVTDTFKSFMERKLSEIAETISGSNNGPLRITTISGKIYRVTQSGEIEEKDGEQEQESRVGQYVSYDEQIWIIIYDDYTNGLQMISKNSMKYNGENFSLGYNDSLVTDWNALISVADLDGSGDLDSFEKSVYSYNNAITTLNTACESLVTPSQYITSVRSVGSNPRNKDSENTTKYTSDNLKNWASGIGNGIGNSTDENYVSDYNVITSLGINNTGSYYWMASRLIDERTDKIYFRVGSFISTGYYSSTSLWRVEESTTVGTNFKAALRPVVSLIDDIQFSGGTGTETDPYIF